MTKKYSRVKRHLRHIGHSVILVQAHIRKNSTKKIDKFIETKAKKLVDDLTDYDPDADGYYKEAIRYAKDFIREILELKND